MSAPVLAYPDPNKEYLLKMDALKLGLGSVLSQKQSDQGYYPVAFKSRALMVWRSITIAQNLSLWP